MVVWKTRNVVAGDEFTGMSDLYAKLWMDGCESQKTDTHLRLGSTVPCQHIHTLCQRLRGMVAFRAIVAFFFYYS